MSWEELWKFFHKQGKEIQKDILRQLDLGSWIDSVSTAVQTEILKFAPVSLQQKYNTSKQGEKPSKTTRQLERELRNIFK